MESVILPRVKSNTRIAHHKPRGRPLLGALSCIQPLTLTITDDDTRHFVGYVVGLQALLAAPDAVMGAIRVLYDEVLELDPEVERVVYCHRALYCPFCLFQASSSCWACVIRSCSGVWRTRRPLNSWAYSGPFWSCRNAP